MTEDRSAERFYGGLQELHAFGDVIDVSRYAEAPRSSLIVLTDVIGSTRAIEAGRYRDVNALGVASIVGVCNAMRDLEVPFVFGGDGATLLVPGSRRAAAERALRGVRALATNSFDLGLRASIVPLEALKAAGAVARVARLRISPHSCLAMFSGSAFTMAEQWVKDPAQSARFEVTAEGESEANFDGFECRWKPVRSRRGNTVNLIVRALGASEADVAATYRRVLDGLERLVADGALHPLTVRGLRFAGPFGDYSVEARVRSGAASGPSYEAAKRRARNSTLIGQVSALTGLTAGEFNARRYRRELVANSDFRKFDDMLRMVVDMSAAELVRLKAFLDEEHGAGNLAYGLHHSSSALITCIVRSYRNDHVHFIDGADGGYAVAARNLKAQLEALINPRRGTR